MRSALQKRCVRASRWASLNRDTGLSYAIFPILLLGSGQCQRWLILAIGLTIIGTLGFMLHSTCYRANSVIAFSGGFSARSRLAGRLNLASSWGRISFSKFFG